MEPPLNCHIAATQISLQCYYSVLLNRWSAGHFLWISLKIKREFWQFNLYSYNSGSSPSKATILTVHPLQLQFPHITRDAASNIKAFEEVGLFQVQIRHIPRHAEEVDKRLRSGQSMSVTRFEPGTSLSKIRNFHSASYSKDARDSGVSRRGMKLATYLHLVSRWRMVGAVYFSTCFPPDRAQEQHILFPSLLVLHKGHEGNNLRSSP